MRAAISETERRRALQQAYNEEHGITPTSIVKAIDDVLSSVYERDYASVPVVKEERPAFRTQAELDAHIAALEKEMKAAAANLDFERAAALRDRVRALKTRELGSAPVRTRRREGRASSPPRKQVSQVRAEPVIEWIKAAVFEVQEYVRLCAAAIRGTVTRPFYRHDVIEQFEAIGIGSLTVVLLTGFFTGAVLALNTGITLDQFGARDFVGRLISASMIKELGPGADRADAGRPRRVGHRRRARLDDGDRSDQRAARARHRSDPQAGRAALLAGFFMTPVLTIIANGGRHRRRLDHRGHQLRVASSLYWTSIIDGLYLEDAWMGLIKPFFLGFVIVTIGCHVGLRTRGGTQGVGRATTNAVVAASVAVIAVDFFITRLLITLMY